MKKNHRNRSKQIARRLAVACALAFACYGKAFAQAEAQQSSQNYIEVIQVTARKISESIQDAPLAVTAFSEQDIQDAGIRETADFVQLTSNVSLAESQSIATSFLTIRGLTQVRNGEAPVAVVVDGVLQFISTQFVSQVFDTEQIEIVKGPQGALYGRNATGGAIIINTKRPDNEAEGHVRLGYGKGTETTIEGSFSTPLIEDELFFKASGRMVNREGYFKNITRNADDDPFFDRALRARLLWQPGDDLSFDLIGNLQRHDGRGIGFQFGAASADDTSLPFVANNEDLGERETNQVSLRIEKEFSGGTLTSVSAYDSVKTLTRADQFPYTELANGVDAVPFGDGTQSQFTDVEALSQEVRYTSSQDRRFRWQVGAYYLSWDRFIASTTGRDTGSGIRIVERTPFLNASTNPTLSYFADDNDNRAWAVFGQGSYDILENLELNLAGRFDEERRSQSVSRFNTGGAPGAINEKTFSNFSPKVTLRYQPTEDVTLFGTWGEGFRSGQFNQNGVAVVALGAGIAGVNDVVRREEARSWELGVKTSWLDNRLNINANYFQTDVEGQQYFVFIGAVGAQVLVNIDQVDIAGFEAEATLRVAEGLDIYASYGSLDSEVVEFATNPALVGNKAPYIPESTMNMGFQWQTALTDPLWLLTRVDYERRGEQFWSPDNIRPRSALNLMNARVALRDADERWELAASLNNATNERYNSEFVLPAFSHQANPRVWRLDFRYNF